MAELRPGTAYYYDAGAEGSTDWLLRHASCPHWDATPGQMRVAFVFRAIKPEHARDYTNVGIRTTWWPGVMPVWRLGCQCGCSVSGLVQCSE